MAFIHVIIPCYNVEKYLEQAVYSVLNQPLQNVDITIVDDGSTDGSAQLCDKIAEREQRVHVIHKTNGGVSSARNTGIDAVLQRIAGAYSGRYIAFLDADDVWEEGFFDENTQEILGYGHDLVGFQTQLCDDSLNPVGKADPLASGLHKGGADAVDLHRGHFAAMLYSCSMLRDTAVRFDTLLRYSEDKIFAIECQYLAGEIWLENRVLYCYRRQAGSAIGQRKYGIEYFEPIIEGYLRMDREMERWSTPERGELRKGREMASIYHMDMVNEHIQHWKSRRDVDDYFAQHPERVDLLLARAPYEWMWVNVTYEQYLEKPSTYLVKHRLLGIIFFLRRKAVSLVRRFR